ncbi:hypothetical protein [uncultured Aquimarina sp.]|uniref:hypothetical protein n=1 Tax=uncultured Aquimarina sp. TaxID=575652 RepID=UPI00262D16B6|nr:hypothetical protein [uncultured Aquimarina sp.]
MIREEVIKLNKLGRMPNEDLDDDDSIDDLIDKYDDLLESIEKPVSFEEGEILIKLFPENAFYDLHWTLLQLIESLFGNIDLDKYETLIKDCPSEEWKETLLARFENSKAKNI